MGSRGCSSHGVLGATSHCGGRTGILPAHPHRGHVGTRVCGHPGWDEHSTQRSCELLWCSCTPWIFSILGHPWDTQHPQAIPVHPAHPALHMDFSRLSPNPMPGCLPPPTISIYYDYFAFITGRASALPHLKSCANSLCITLPSLAGKGCTVGRERSGLGERRRCRPRAPTTRAHGCSPGG